MKLNIISIHGHGDYENEYVFMKAEEECNAGHYMLADSTYSSKDPKKYSNKVRHTFWFPDKIVNAGEYVSLRTGKGKPTVIVKDNGNTIHRFYWDLEEAVWNDTGDCAVLFELNGWRSYPTTR